MSLQRSRSTATRLRREEVHRAYRRLADPHGRPGTLDRHLLEAMLGEWEAWRTPDGPYLTCPNCSGYVHLAYLSGHFAHCPRHPAFQRLPALRSALRWAPTLLRAVGRVPLETEVDLLAAAEEWLRVPSPRPSSVEDDRWLLRRKLELLCGWRAEGTPAPDEAKTLAAFQIVFTEWERAFFRETDPCPFCSAVLPLESFAAHLDGCQLHPAHALASRLEANLAASLGAEAAHELVALVRQHHRTREELHFLWLACEKYVAEMGWSGECAYSDQVSERPWRVAREHAEKVVGFTPAPPRTPRPSADDFRQWPPFAAPVAEALRRLARLPAVNAEAVAASPDVGLLRQARDELLELAQRYGKSNTCPYCRRSGVPVLESVRHLETCLLRPSSLRRRSLEAELRVLSAVASQPADGATHADLPIDRCPTVDRLRPEDDPEEARMGPKSFGLRYLRSKLAVLAEPDAERQTSFFGSATSPLEDLESAFQLWQRYRSTQRTDCSLCHEQIDLASLPDHHAGCSSPEELGALQRLEQRLAALRGNQETPLAELQAQSDELRLALAALLEACECFWNRMDEGERGKSLVPERLWPPFDAARARAKALLQRSAFPETGSTT